MFMYDKESFFFICEITHHHFISVLVQKIKLFHYKKKEAHAYTENLILTVC